MNLPGLVDFHCHSTASDGSLAPAQLVEAAAAQGIGLMALTDHDTVAGLAPARAKAQELGIGWIDGIELSAKFAGGHLHILGYGFDPTHPGLLAGLSAFRQARKNRLTKILDKLSHCGLPLEEADLDLSEGTSPGRPHIAAAMVAKEYVKDQNQAFDEYLGHQGKAYADKEIFGPQETIALIKNAGGLAVVAHPISLYLKRSELADYLEYLKGLGLDGIEAYNSSHQNDQCNRLVKIAAQLDLLVTGGSDFHGTAKPLVQLGRLKKGRKILSKWISPQFFDTLGIETT
ncbi:MAG: PHP domain-containing protein [bacterium]|nr:PHP domain-containing protein [bacterium]